MKLKEISIHVARTFNTGNYQSIRLEAGAVATVEKDDEAGAVTGRLVAETRERLTTLWREFHPDGKKQKASADTGAETTANPTGGTT